MCAALRRAFCDSEGGKLGAHRPTCSTTTLAYIPLRQRTINTTTTRRHSARREVLSQAVKASTYATAGKLQNPFFFCPPPHPPSRHERKVSFVSCSFLFLFERVTPTLQPQDARVHAPEGRPGRTSRSRLRPGIEERESFLLPSFCRSAARVQRPVIPWPPSYAPRRLLTETGIFLFFANAT